VKSVSGRLVAAVVSAAVVAAGTQLAGAAPVIAAPPQATVTIDTAHPFGRMPSDFVGLSYEMRELATWCTTGECVGNFDAKQGNLVQLLRTLGRSDLRIGGNQLDRDTLWVPAGQPRPDPLPSWTADVVTAEDIARLKGLLTVTGWKAQVGINLAHYDPALAADEAHALTSVLGSRLSGVACGNEPNHYASNHYRPAPYGFAEHRADWEACVALVEPGAPISGPDLSQPTGTAAWFGQFAQAERDRVAMFTIHNYTGARTIEQLLSPAVHDSELANAAPQLAAAQAAGVPIRMDETNSAVGGGIDGVSNVYASALWAFDYNMVMAQAGFAGLNFHGGFGVCGAPLYNGRFQRYTPICAANVEDMRAKVYRAAPEYYGLYMATRMGPGRFLPVTLAGDHNITAYAVRGDDGRTRIALIDKEPTTGAAVPVSLNVPGAHGSAHVIRMTGSTLDSAEGVAVQGSQVDRKGRLHPGQAEHLQVRDGLVSLEIAAGSAVIITLDTCAELG
jgi:Glycosyl hydrolase family 79 C-terminal beta domain